MSFIRLNWFDCKKANHAVVFSLVSAIRATKLKQSVAENKNNALSAPRLVKV